MDTSLALIYVVVFLEVLTLAFQSSVPVLEQNFFASKEAGEPQNCEQQLDNLYCIAGSVRTIQFGVIYKIAFSFTHSFISVFAGKLSDQFGRKVFMTAALVYKILIINLCMLSWYHAVSLYWYFFVCLFSIPMTPLMLAAVSDMTTGRGEYRFGLVGLTMAVGFIASSILLQVVTIPTVFIVSMIGCVVAVMVLVGVPEMGKRSGEVPSIAESPADNTLAYQDTDGRGIFSFQFRKSPFLKSLFLLMFFIHFMQASMDNVLMQLLRLRFGFMPKDMAVLFSIIAVISIPVFGVVGPYLISQMGERPVLVMAIILMSIHYIGYCLSSTKFQIYLFGAMAPFGYNLIALSCNTLIMRSGYDQGEIRGAMQALTGIATGVGPLISYGIIKTTASVTRLGDVESIQASESCVILVMMIVCTLSVYRLGDDEKPETSPLATPYMRNVRTDRIHDI